MGNVSVLRLYAPPDSAVDTDLRPPPKTADRLPELDGLRAVAVLMVVGYHFLYRFPDYYPYPALTGSMFRFGDMGVSLFFIISGFVIAMTLKGSRSISEFAIRRFSRLWPPILVCSVLTFLMVWAVATPFTLARRTPLTGFLPSLTFLPPEIWSQIVGPTDYVDGVYWSLFVEVRFYLIASLTYFFVSRNRGPEIMTILAALACPAYVLLGWVGAVLPLKALSLVLFPQFLPLLCAGMLFFELFSGNRSIKVIAYLALCYLLALSMSGEISRAALVTMFFGIFVCFIWARPVLRLLQVRSLRWIGLTSYSIYLLHQNIGLTIITSLDPALPTSVLYAGVAVVALGAIGLASIVYLTIERQSRAVARVISLGLQRLRP